MSKEIIIKEENYITPAENYLKKYSLVLLMVSGAVFAYSILRVLYCSLFSSGVYADFCKLSGVAYFSFYALPMLILGLIGLSLPKLTESNKTKLFFLIILTISTVRFFYSFITSFLA